MGLMDLLNDHLLNKIYRVKWIVDKGTLLQFTTAMLLQRISDLAHFDEVNRNNMLCLSVFYVIYIKSIERNMNGS